MPKKRNHYFMERCRYVRAGTIEPMHIKDILTKDRFFAAPNTSKTHYDMKFGKEVKTIMVVNTSLHSLIRPVSRSDHYLKPGVLPS